MATNADGTQNPDGQQSQSGQNGDTTTQNRNGGNPADTNGGGQGGQNNQQQQPRKFEYSEDRSDWAPRHRLNEESGKRTKAEERAAAAEARAEAAEKRVKALAGVETPGADEVEEQQVRERLYKMFPQMQALEGLTAEQLQEVLAAAQGARQTTQTTWERHAETVLSDIEEQLSDALGQDKLTERQQKGVRRAYREEIAAAVAARRAAHERGDTSYDAASDALSKHERGDKAFLKTFVEEYVADWFEPAKRSVTQRTVSRLNRPVPRNERGRTITASQPPEIDYNNEDAFKKAIREARASR